MKRFSLVLLIAGVLACGREGFKPGVTACTTALTGAQRCEGTWVQQCNGMAWVGQTDCAATGEVCRPGDTASTASCAAGIPEGQPCAASGECATGLECYEWGDGESACLDLCDAGDGSGCLDGAASVCVELLAGGGLCLDAAQSGELCFVDAQCVSYTDLCFGFVVTEEGLLGTCTERCAHGDINHGQGTCDPDNVCLASEYLAELQPDSATCSSADASRCDGSAGYYCIDFGASLGPRCAREVGQCGHALPTFAAIPAAQPPESERCGVAYDSGDNRNFCGFADPSATAFAYCYSGLFGAEAPSQGLCFAVCGGLDGAPDLSCGAGYTCARPLDANSAVSFDVQRAGDGVSRVACDLAAASPDAPCDTASGYSCQSLDIGTYCGIPSKMCTPT